MGRSSLAILCGLLCLALAVAQVHPPGSPQSPSRRQGASPIGASGGFPPGSQDEYPPRPPPRNGEMDGGSTQPSTDDDNKPWGKPNPPSDDQTDNYDENRGGGSGGERDRRPPPPSRREEYWNDYRPYRDIYDRMGYDDDMRGKGRQGGMGEDDCDDEMEEYGKGSSGDRDGRRSSGMKDWDDDDDMRGYERGGMPGKDGRRPGGSRKYEDDDRDYMWGPRHGGDYRGPEMGEIRDVYDIMNIMRMMGGPGGMFGGVPGGMFGGLGFLPRCRCEFGPPRMRPRPRFPPYYRRKPCPKPKRPRHVPRICELIDRKAGKVIFNQTCHENHMCMMFNQTRCSNVTIRICVHKECLRKPLPEIRKCMIEENEKMMMEAREKMEKEENYDKEVEERRGEQEESGYRVQGEGRGESMERPSSEKAREWLRTKLKMNEDKKRMPPWIRPYLWCLEPEKPKEMENKDMERDGRRRDDMAREDGSRRMGGS